MRIFTLRDVAEIGLICAVMSAFPLVAYAYGTSADSTWRLSSGIQGVWSIAGIAATFRRRGSSRLPLRQHGFMFGLVICLASVNFVLIGMNVASPSSLSGARYVSCMLLALTQAGFMFLLAAFDLGRSKTAT